MIKHAILNKNDTKSQGRVCMYMRLNDMPLILNFGYMVGMKMGCLSYVKLVYNLCPSVKYVGVLSLSVFCIRHWAYYVNVCKFLKKF